MTIRLRRVVPLLFLAGMMLVVVACGGDDASNGNGEEPPVPIGHTLVGRTDCTLCHESGLSDIPQEPQGHEGRTDQLCTICHKPLGEEAAGALGVPHSIAGRTECLICHTTGIASAPATGDEMSDLSNEHCLLCHLADDGTEFAIGPGEGIPSVTHVLDTPQAPHSLGGKTECLACHSASIPTGHAGRIGTGETCTLCHRGTDSATLSPTTGSGGPSSQAETPTAAPTAPAGTATEMPTATRTAAVDVTQPTPTPTRAPTVGPTAVPTTSAERVAPPVLHTLEGRSDCLLCHAASVPADHQGRPNETCAVCHKAER